MKKEIVARLLKDGHIDFGEALELMDVNSANTTQPPILQPCTPIQQPSQPFLWPYHTTCDTFNGIRAIPQHGNQLT